MLQVSGQGGGDAGGEGGGEGGSVAAVHGDAGGGAEDSGEDVPDLGNGDRLQRGVRADIDHVRGAGDGDGDEGLGVQDPAGVAVGLRRGQRHHLGPLLRPRGGAGGPEVHRQREGLLGVAEDGSGALHLHPGHGGGGGGGDQAAGAGKGGGAGGDGGGGAAEHLVADPAVLPRRRRRGLHLHRAAGVFLRPVARRHEEPLQRLLAVRHRAGELPELLHPHRGGHHHRRQRRRRVDTGQPERGPPGLLLLAPGRAQLPQPPGLPLLRRQVPVQEDLLSAATAAAAAALPCT